LPSIEPLLLCVTRVNTFVGNAALTNASGFFFARDERLFLVTSRHVLHDKASEHWPDRIEIELHLDEANVARSTGFSIPLYQQRHSVWRQGEDTAGGVDIAVVEIERGALPATALYRAFTPAHLIDGEHAVEIGTPLLIVGFPLGFHDTLHHMPVARHAIVASSFGLRFQGQGYFLTDARTHRGTSGAPVVMRVQDGAAGLGDLGWRLLGIHSSRLDIGDRDVDLDEALGLNCAWYADILMRLTAR
jgi:S1-C subfamily serine protease